MTRLTVAVGAGLVVAAVAAVGQGAPDRGARMTIVGNDTAEVAPFQTTPRPTTSAVRAAVQVIPRMPELALPPVAASNGVYLSAIPDWLLNDPPSARFRVAVEVRGRAGLATADRPASVAWTEDGFWYELSSRRMTIGELIHLASALE
ncbi:MAG: hypothetical protein ACRDGT_01270 [Candidatus Limnocylindria bacterium]